MPRPANWPIPTTPAPTRPSLPALWQSALFRVYWDPHANGFISLDASPAA